MPSGASTSRRPRTAPWNGAEMVATLPAVREAFAARDREGLLAQCAEMFKRQKERYGVDQAQFHIPPAVSFLRLHAPEQHGDHQDPVPAHGRRGQSRSVLAQRDGHRRDGAAPSSG